MKVIKWIDLFGVEVTDYRFDHDEPHGYPKTPGSGSEGETCKTCEHRVRMSAGNRKFYKCAMNREKWGNSIASDIVLKMPACALWEKSLSKVARRA
jgi:hypothetical protein